MHKIDDPNMPPPHLLRALRRHSAPKRLGPCVRRTLAGWVLDDIARQIAREKHDANGQERGRRRRLHSPSRSAGARPRS